MPEAGWYLDPLDSTAIRYWDGDQWTDHVAPNSFLPAEPVATEAVVPEDDAADATVPEPVTSPSEGWYEDPIDPLLLRYWDGREWTDHVAPAPTAPPAPAPAAAPVTTDHPTGAREQDPTPGARPSRRMPPKVVPVAVVAVIAVVAAAVWWATTRSDDRPVAATGPSTTLLASTDRTTCAVAPGGAVRCWGSDRTGELGVPAASAPDRAVTLEPQPGATAIAGGGGGFCVVGPGSGLRCWGTGSSVPARRSIGAVRDVAVAADHSCAVLADGSVRCWGANELGQLGAGHTDRASGAVSVTGLSGATTVAVGPGFSCVTVRSGEVRCWGTNEDGQLGIAATDRVGASRVPVVVPGVDHAVRVVSGGTHVCAVTGAGTVDCWGANERGQLGLGSAAEISPPTPVAGLFAVTSFATSPYLSCAVTQGKVRCWGDDTFGQLGTGRAGDPSDLPVVAALRGRAVTVTVGSFHACAALAGATVLCWGDDEDGQLGDGGSTGSAVPVRARAGG